MTLAELLSTVQHAKDGCDKEGIPYHKVEVKINVDGQGQVLDVYPGKLNLAGGTLELEAE